MTESVSSDTVSDDSFRTERWVLNPEMSVRRAIFRNLQEKIDEESKAKAQEKCCKMFDDDLKSGENVYEMVLQMVRNMPEKKKKKGKVMCNWVLEHFEAWKEDKTDVLEKWLTDEVKKHAEHRGSKETYLAEALRRIFRLNPEDVREGVMRLIHQCLEVQKFKEAADFAMVNGLVDEFPFEAITFPLILGGNYQSVIELMKKSVKVQKAYVRFLDNFVDQTDESINAFFEPYKHRMKIGPERFYGKSHVTNMNKLFSGPVKQFQFDLEESRDAPNLDFVSKRRALQYHWKRRFEGDIEDDIYFQHAKGVLEKCDRRVLHNFLHIGWTSENREHKIDILAWISYLHIPKSGSHLPSSLEEFYRNPDAEMIEASNKLLESRTASDESLIEKTLFATVREKQYPIRIVRDGEGIEKLCDELERFGRLQDSSDHYVGFDSEWKPSHLTEPNSTKLSTAQLFFDSKAWIVDCVELENPNKKVEDDLWARFLRALFNSVSIKVVGFDLKNDLDALLAMPPLRGVLKTEQIANTWCLKKLTENVCEMDMAILGLPKKTFKLADLTDRLIGVQLDKSEQCSNWQYRPLRDKQIVYAATDAIVVVEVFQEVVRRVVESDPRVDLDKLWRDANVMALKKERVKRETRKIKSYSWIEIYEILHPHRNPSKPLQRPTEIKVIIDAMLLGFGKSLQLFGIDVLFPSSRDAFRAFVSEQKTTADKDKRYVVTVPSKILEELQSECDPDNVIVLSSVYKKDSRLDILIEFFDFLNLDIRPDDGYFCE